MDLHRQRFLAVALAVSAVQATPSALGQRFFPDDPVRATPPSISVESARQREVGAAFDFFYQSYRRDAPSRTPAGAVNTLGEVPDSAWFVNRHGRDRMGREELQRGPDGSRPPVPPFSVVGAKTEGVTPGFRMRDATGRLFFVKGDPKTNPEMATAAEVIVGRFFHALGYNVPDNYILVTRRDELSVAKGAAMTGAGGRPRSMTERDLDDVLARFPRYPDGDLRFLASSALAGQPLGPFKFEGVRSDDPNDIVPHQDRRDLRGLHVFAAWLNHTDAKAGNTLDTLVEENGLRFIRHHLIDFGAALGSDSDRPKDPRLGHETMLLGGMDTVRRALGFGVFPRDWELVDYETTPAVGNLQAELFDPDEWTSNYPNPAFRDRLPDDEYWAATHVMAFTDDDIRAIVETGEYSDPGDAEYVTRMLIERRDEIGRKYFRKVLALDRFRVENGRLRFDDLLVEHGFAPPRQYEIEWSRFDNDAESHSALSDERTSRLPREWEGAPASAYYAARLHVAEGAEKTVRVYLRKGSAGGAEVVGVERTW